MKTATILIMIVLFTLLACKTEKKMNTTKIDFAIYETVMVKEIPNSIIDILKTTNIQFETNTQQPIVGYILKSESFDLSILSKDNIKLLKTAYTIDNDNKYFALVAVKRNPELTGSNIKMTKENNENVEIHFNSEGTIKWTDITRNNIGKMVAFIVENEILSMPYVNGEIKSGIALINGLESELIAKKI